MEKITHITTVQWTGNDGKIRTDIVGLGEDGQMYQWHKGTGKWILYVIQSN